MYVDGKKLRVNSLSIINPTDLEKLANPLENFYKICPSCNYISFQEADLYCPRCNEELIKRLHVGLSAFFGRDVGKITSQEEIRQQKDYLIDYFLLDTANNASSNVNSQDSQFERVTYHYFNLDLEYVRGGEVFIVNGDLRELGSRSGFEICPVCGRWKNPEEGDHWDQKHRNRHNCEGNPQAFDLSNRTHRCIDYFTVHSKRRTIRINGIDKRTI